MIVTEATFDAVVDAVDKCIATATTPTGLKIKTEPWRDKRAIENAVHGLLVTLSGDPWAFHDHESIIWGFPDDVIGSFPPYPSEIAKHQKPVAA